MAQRGLPTIIVLSFVLAVGFLMIILSAALYHNFLTLLVAATYVLAPLPNWICRHCANPDDFMESGNNGVIDFGRFSTGALCVMGVALPLLLAHCALIQLPAMIMSIIGGICIYSTIIAFSQFFAAETEDF